MQGRIYWAMTVTMLILFALLSAVYYSALWFFGANIQQGLMYMIPFVLGFTLLQWYIGPGLIKLMTRMSECSDKHILDIIEDEARKANIPVPKTFLVQNSTPNAFAFGRTQKSSNIALHTGLIHELNQQELRGVIAHEIGHIKHRDVVVMTLASVMPTLLFYIFYFGSLMAGSRDERGGGMGWLGAYFGGLFAQFIGSLLVLYLSRVREYAADAHSAESTHDPDALASALAKISYGLAHSKIKVANPTLNSFYVLDQKTSFADLDEHMNKEEKHGRFLEIFMSHPLTSKRIKALREMRA